VRVGHHTNILPLTCTPLLSKNSFYTFSLAVSVENFHGDALRATLMNSACFFQITTFPSPWESSRACNVMGTPTSFVVPTRLIKDVHDLRTFETSPAATRLQSFIQVFDRPSLLFGAVVKKLSTPRLSRGTRCRH